MTMSLSTGLVSGMDTGSLITQLIQAEAAPQSALKARLTATQTAASAYRTVNTTFAAVRAAAEALTSAANLSTGRKAASNNDGVTVSASSAAVSGTSLTFTPSALAETHIVLSNSQWTSTSGSVRAQDPGWPIEIRKADGTTVVGTVDVAPGATLAEAVTAINDANLGVKATIVSLSPTKHRLQLVSTTPGEAGQFILKSATESEATAGAGFPATKTGQDATLSLGNGVVATSATNTFTDLMPGVTVTISKAGTAATISVASDQEGVAAKMQTLVDAVNAAANTVRTYTSNATGSTAALKGDYAVTSLGSQLLDAVSTALGGDGSAVQIGLQLSKDGKKVEFNKATFVTALTEKPALVQRMVVDGSPATNGVDGAAGTIDDVTAVTGIAQRLLSVAKSASDSATGSLVSLANGQDSLVKTYQDRIAAWDLRLAKRKETLTRQFTAMETALSSLRNQSTWLAGQINSLPSSS